MDSLENLQEYEKVEFFGWYTLRILPTNEDKIVSSLLEKIDLYNLSSQIKKIEVLKEFTIEESKEYSPGDENLPQRGLKSGKSYLWVKNINGNYKKIKLVEKRPFKGMVFVNMINNYELFKRVKTFELGIYFLGDPTPTAITDAKYEAMKSSLNKEIPSLEQYVKERNYVVVKGKIKELNSLKVEAKFVEHSINKKIEKTTDSKVLDKPFEEAVNQDFYVNKGNKFTDVTKFKVNDFVFVQDFGVQGLIKSIDHNTKEAVVSVNVFGRQQPIVCNTSQLSEI